MKLYTHKEKNVFPCGGVAWRLKEIDLKLAEWGSSSGNGGDSSCSSVIYWSDLQGVIFGCILCALLQISMWFCCFAHLENSFLSQLKSSYCHALNPSTGQGSSKGRLCNSFSTSQLGERTKMSQPCFKIYPIEQIITFSGHFKINHLPSIHQGLKG